jgi:small subunit ribosomal protein S1
MGTAMHHDHSAIPAVGETVRGRVVRLREEGAFLEIGQGIQGYLHRSRISWLNKRINVNDAVKIGDEIDVVVLDVDCSKNGNVYISLGHIQTQANPWETVELQHPIGSRARATVVKFLPFGARVELESGFCALVHKSEISWTDKKAAAQEFLRLGDEVEVVIQLVDKKKRRLHASRRLAIENPWLTFLDRFPIGTVTSGRVVSLRIFGALVMLGNGCVGLLHKDNYPSGELAVSVGDSVEVTILAFDQEKQHISLGAASA